MTTIHWRPPRCDERKAWCHCTLDAGHAGPHICEGGYPPCGGSWSYDIDGSCVVHAWPWAQGLGPMLGGSVPSREGQAK